MNITYTSERDGKVHVGRILKRITALTSNEVIRYLVVKEDGGFETVDVKDILKDKFGHY